MSGPLPQANDTPDALRYRHLRAIAGLVGMVLAVALFVLIQLTRNAHDAAYELALLAKGCPPPSSVIPTGIYQLIYVFAVPVGMPLLIFVFSAMLFSPTVFGQLRQLLPWVKSA